MKHLLFISLMIIVASCTRNQSDSDKKGGEEIASNGEVWKASSPKEKLGYHLYFETRFSEDRSLSCNSCHDITNRGNGAMDTPVAEGINAQKGGRNSPTVWNAKFLSVQFWDGRAKDLAEQAKGPIINPVEMGMTGHDAAIARLKEVDEYKKLFKEAYPDYEGDPINLENAVGAIAAFEETLTTLDTPYDSKSMSKEAQKGLETFQEVGCVACHSGDHFAGPNLPVGTGFYMKFPTYPNEELEKKYGFKKDKGRFEATGEEGHQHMWRVPTLRNVAVTGPYFHNGAVEDLETAIRVMGKLQLDKDLSDEQVSSIKAFLTALTGKKPLIKEPEQL